MTTTYAASEQDLTDFREVGYFIAPDVFTADECDAALDHIEQAAFELALGDPDAGPLSYRPMMHLLSPELTEIATDARWAPIVLPLLGTGDARLYWEQAVSKPPQARTELPWHQDNGYTPLIPEEYVTCWLALDDSHEGNGCLWVIPGSHHDGTQRHVNDGSGSPFRVGYDGPAADGIAVPVAKGSVLVFSSLVMHRSGPNTSDDPRRAWIIQFCSAGARSALSKRLLDDRLLVADQGRWLDQPIRQRDIDLISILANYDQR